LAEESLRVLLMHNRYRRRGGEDAVFELEAELLARNGVEVETFETENPASQAEIARIALSASSSRRSSRRVGEICSRFRPHVAHTHNSWLKLTSSVHRACRDSGATTVQTLHNFRLICANALLLRQGRVCEDCVGKPPWRGTLSGCYRESRGASALVEAATLYQRASGVWRRDVDAFITLSESSQERFLRAGLPAERLFVKPNSVADPGEAARPPSRSLRFVYVGRLSEEKGVDVLIRAWRMLRKPQGATLTLVGDGPLRDQLQRETDADVAFTGALPHDETLDVIARARCLVLPTRCLENSPVALLEAMIRGRAVIASDLGAAAELVGPAGLLFPPEIASELTRKLAQVANDDSVADRLGLAARLRCRERHGPEANLASLLSIYRSALKRGRRPLPGRLRDSNALASIA